MVHAPVVTKFILIQGSYIISCNHQHAQQLFYGYNTVTRDMTEIYA